MNKYFYTEDLVECYIRASKLKCDIYDYFGVNIDVFETEESIKPLFCCENKISKSRAKNNNEDLSGEEYINLIEEKKNYIRSKIRKKDYS